MSATLARSVPLVSVGSGWARATIITALLAGAAAGVTLGASAAGPSGDVELTHLLRAMAMLKLLFVGAASGAIWWRLALPIGPARLAFYAIACAAMAAGPGLIWFLAHVGAAATLLHGGVAAAILLLWRDPAAARLLDQTIAQRRARILTGN